MEIASPGFDDELVRRLAILKLWQVESDFDFEIFTANLATPSDGWDDVRQLLGAARAGRPGRNRRARSRALRLSGKADG
jgi:hypothetical protein